LTSKFSALKVSTSKMVAEKILQVRPGFTLLIAKESLQH
jgi:hypothetical protein